MAVLHQLTRRLESLEDLDGPAKVLAGAVSRAVRPKPVRDLLSGKSLGHSLHPVLTDVPIGAWTMGVLLDAVGGEECEGAADLLLGVGVLASTPTSLTGLNDWSDTLGGPRRVGLVHAGANVVGLGLFMASLAARRAGKRRGGKALALAGLTAVSAGAYLGGHLVFANGVTVNHTAFENRPEDWTAVLPYAELAEGRLVGVDAAGAGVLLYRAPGSTTVQAMASTCSHLGGPLQEGSVEDGCVTCPWHGSVFALEDGAVQRGPASQPQPMYDTRVRDGRIEVRARE